MEAVAKALRVTKPVIYACFGSREELVDALLEREEQKLVTGIMSALPGQLDFGDPARMFADGFEALVRVVDAHPGSFELVFAAEPDPSVAKRYGQARQRVSARVGELMALGLAHYGKTDIERKLPFLVELFMSAGDAAVRTMMRREHGWTPRELGEFVGRVVQGALIGA
jgi:AcrR family transcriptional regulator